MACDLHFFICCKLLKIPSTNQMYKCLCWDLDQMKYLGFFILLAGFMQDDDEADTVGCCTLKVENVKAVAPNTLEVQWEKF